MKKHMTPVKIAVAMVALNFALNIARSFTPLREAGLAWATSRCASLHACILARAVAGEVRGIVDREVLASFARSVGAALAMGAAVFATSFIVPSGDSTVAMATALVAKVAVGAITFCAVAIALRMPELGWALGRKLPFLRSSAH